MLILVDANIFLSVILNEPEKTKIIKLTLNSELISANVLPFEIGNALSAMGKQKRLSKDEIFSCYSIYQQIPIRLVSTELKTALEIALKNNIYAYDAYYLEIAKRLNAPILTLDQKMIEVANRINIRTLEVL